LRRKFSVAYRPWRLEQPGQHLAKLGRRHRLTGGGLIAFDVVDGTGQHIQIIVQAVELGLGDDQLMLTELQFTGPLTAHPVPLATRLAAEHPWPAHLLGWEHSTAPSAPRSPLLTIIVDFRHDESVSEKAPSQRELG